MWHAKYETKIFSRKISGAKEVVWPGGGDYGRLSVRPGWDWSKRIDKESSPTYLDSCETLFLMYVWCLKLSFLFGIFFKRCIVGWRGTTTTRRTEETTLRWPSCTLNAATSGLRWEKTMGMCFFASILFRSIWRLVSHSTIIIIVSQISSSKSCLRSRALLRANLYQRSRCAAQTR